MCSRFLRGADFRGSLCYTRGMKSYSPEACVFLANLLKHTDVEVAPPATRGREEIAFNAKYDPSKYNPDLDKDSLIPTADACVLTVDEGVLKVLLIQRGNHPFKGYWCLPGGFVDAGEPLEAAAVRELEEETGLTGVAPRLVCVNGEPWRDPRHKYIVSYTFSFLVEKPEPVEGLDDAQDAQWVPVLDVLTGVVPVGFDHHSVIKKAVLLEFTS